MPFPLEQFGQRVQLARQQLDISQEVLAERCGFDRTYVSLLENGKRNPPLVSICRLAWALNVTPAQLLDGVDAVEGEE